jgi:hypothetical protein
MKKQFCYVKTDYQMKTNMRWLYIKYILFLNMFLFSILIK